MRHASARIVNVLCTAAIVPTLLACTSAEANDAKHFQVSYQAEYAGKLSGALSALSKVSKHGRGQYMFHLRTGWLLYKSGKHARAVTAYKRAIAVKPKAIEPRLGITLPQMALRRFADAAQSAQSAARIDKDNYLVTSRLAYCQYNLGRYAKAASNYKRVVVLYPGDIEMRVGLAWALVKLGKGKAAKRHFQLVLGISPNHANARLGLSLLN